MLQIQQSFVPPIFKIKDSLKLTLFNFCVPVTIGFDTAIARMDACNRRANNTAAAAT